MRVHQTLKTTPAVAAGADHVWTMDELIAILERAEANAAEASNSN